MSGSLESQEEHWSPGSGSGSALRLLSSVDESHLLPYNFLVHKQKMLTWELNFLSAVVLSCDEVRNPCEFQPIRKNTQKN